ncbi:hypothetical protein CHS0354_014338 [Potamilus streckersoni]|uniref:Ig-like domain-containing protein n=1 Tax=Potamilus streckersoni TaxID=2493646 RepID=A0AAE0SKU8_9BIVA|nr:hypothetical protein CHS0354_014338 [Potamilus streckersoni]
MSTFLACFLIGSILSGTNGVLVKVAVNGRAILPCNVQNSGDNTVRWFKNPNTVISISLHVVAPLKKRMSIMQPYSGEWNLHIEQVQLGDAGDYSCRVGKDVIEQIDLIVETPPMIHETHETTFNEGDTGTLWCNATGSPTPIVRWFFKSPHQTDGIGQDSEAEGNRLVLHNITRYYDNLYVCLASNTVGVEQREIRIHVNFGPEVEVFQNTVNAALGQEVTLHCMVTAYPMDGELEWVFLNENLPIRANWKYELVSDLEMIKDYNTLFASMIIRKGHFGDGDYGHYVCRTKNFSRGHSEKMFNVQKPVEHNEDGIIRYEFEEYTV